MRMRSCISVCFSRTGGENGSRDAPTVTGSGWSGPRSSDAALSVQLVEHTVDRRFQFLPRALVARLERIDDLGAGRLLFDGRPDLGPRVAQAVVRTRSEVDDDRLAFDRLGDGVLAAHTETFSHSRPQTPLSLKNSIGRRAEKANFCDGGC